MSLWREVKDEDIDLDFRQNQVDILVSEDYNGNNYVTLTFKQIEDICKKINRETCKG